MGLSCAWRCKSYVLLNLTFLATWLCFQVLAVSRTPSLSTAGSAVKERRLALGGRGLSVLGGRQGNLVLYLRYSVDVYEQVRTTHSATPSRCHAYAKTRRPDTRVLVAISSTTSCRW